VLCEEKRAARAQDSGDLGEGQAGVLDRAKNQRRDHSVGTGVVQRQALSRSCQNRGTQREGLGPLPKLRRHVSVGLGKNQIRDSPE
jgi:hypothetical protein